MREARATGRNGCAQEVADFLLAVLDLAHVQENEDGASDEASLERGVRCGPFFQGRRIRREQAEIVGKVLFAGRVCLHQEMVQVAGGYPQLAEYAAPDDKRVGGLGVTRKLSEQFLFEKPREGILVVADPGLLPEAFEHLRHLQGRREKGGQEADAALYLAAYLGCSAGCGLCAGERAQGVLGLCQFPLEQFQVCDLLPQDLQFPANSTPWHGRVLSVPVMRKRPEAHPSSVARDV